MIDLKEAQARNQAMDVSVKHLSPPISTDVDREISTEYLRVGTSVGDEYFTSEYGEIRVQWISDHDIMFVTHMGVAYTTTQERFIEMINKMHQESEPSVAHGLGAGDSREKEMVDHPRHYGGKNNPYETIQVLEAWGLDRDFCLANAVKYLSRAGKKNGSSELQDIEKALWYLQRKVDNLKGINKKYVQRLSDG